MRKENKKEKKLIGKSKYIFIVLALLYMGVSIAFVLNILKLELLPIKYSSILVAGFSILSTNAIETPKYKSANTIYTYFDFPTNFFSFLFSLLINTPQIIL